MFSSASTALAIIVRFLGILEVVLCLARLGDDVQQACCELAGHVM